MADSSLTRENLWCKLTIQEEQYYNALAECCLLQEGVKTLTVKQLKARIDYLSSPLKKTILLGKPLTFRANKLALESSWYKVIEYENQYYQTMAECNLFDEGICNPSEEEIQNRIKHLSHIYLRKTIFLRPLKQRELECLEQASFGRGSRETAIVLNISEVIVKKYRISTCDKLRCEKMSEAVCIGTHANYLPLRNKHALLQTLETEELGNASI